MRFRKTYKKKKGYGRTKKRHSSKSKRTHRITRRGGTTHTEIEKLEKLENQLQKIRMEHYNRIINLMQKKKEDRTPADNALLNNEHIQKKIKHIKEMENKLRQDRKIRKEIRKGIPLKNIKEKPNDDNNDDEEGYLDDEFESD